MRRGNVFDPRLLRTMMPVGAGLASRARCTVYRQNLERPGWTAGIGNTDDGLVAIWQGFCRVQPLIDMRARFRNFDGEYDAAEGVRFNLPIERNELGGQIDDNGKFIIYGDDPVFGFGDIVDVTKTLDPGQKTLLVKRFTVRNAMMSTTAPQFDLLCDVGTSCMAKDGFYWYTDLDPDIIGQKFSVFASELPFTLGTAVSEALDVAVHAMRTRVLELGRIRTGDMFNSISSEMTVAPGGRVSGQFGFIDAAPFYTLFQEYGTRRGIMAMHAFTEANIKFYDDLTAKIDVADIWKNLRF